MEQMHSLLRRQLRRHLGDQFSIPKEWQGFIRAVNEAYRESAADLGMLERSLEFSCAETGSGGIREFAPFFGPSLTLCFDLTVRARFLLVEAGDTIPFP